MDPLDEFEFAPLTEGLGFHKKTSTIREDMKRVVLKEDFSSIPDPPRELLFSEELSPLPEGQGVPHGDPTRSLRAVQDIVRSLPKDLDYLESGSPRPQMPYSARYDQTASIRSTPSSSGSSVAKRSAIKLPVEPSAAQQAPEVYLIRTPPLFVSCLFDGIICFGLALLFLTVLLMITKADLGLVLENAKIDFMTQLSLAAIAAAVIQLYMIISRSFFGRTLGEWAFEVQLGRKQDQESAFYPFLVAWRSVLIFITGIIVLPLFSMIFKRDLVFYLSGTQLFRQS